MVSAQISGLFPESYLYLQSKKSWEWLTKPLSYLIRLPDSVLHWGDYNLQDQVAFAHLAPKEQRAKLV